MKQIVCLLALSILGTCHNRHVDVSEQVRAGRTMRVRDSGDRIVKSIDDSTVIGNTAAFMAQHADAWSGEEIFGTLPTSQLLLDVLNEKGELLVGVGIGDQSLWIYPSKGVWREIDRAERDRLLGVLGIQATAVSGFKPDDRGRRTRG